MRRPALLALVIAACTPATTGAPPPREQAAAPAEAVAPPPVLEGMLDGTAPVAAAEPAAEPAPAPAFGPLEPGPGLRKVVELRGWDVVAAPGRIVVLDQDFLHVRAIDARTGAELWRNKVQERANGRHTMFPVGERVLLFAGPTLVAIDVRDGRVVGSHPAGGFHGGDDSCGLHVVRDLAPPPWRGHVPGDSDRVACAVSCSCSLALLRCDTGAPLIRFDSSVTHIYHSLSEPHDNVCWKPPKLLGRVKGRTLVVHEGESGEYTAAALEGDKVAWREPWLGDVLGRYRPVGGDAAGDACWSSDGDQLVVWTCSTGKLRWRAEFERPDDGYVDAEVRVLAPGRLLVERRGAARNLVEARALAGGKLLWRRALAADRRILLPGAVPPPIWDATTTYTRVDPATGATRSEIAVAPREVLMPDPRGGWVRAGTGYAEIDADGREVRAVAKDMSGMTWLGEKLLAVGGDERLTVLRRADLSPALDVAGKFSIAAADAALGADALLVHEHRGAEPLRIALLRGE